MRAIEPADERFHPVDPDDRAWNESWFFSWIDLDGGPAGFFRVGVLPNQGRAMLWCFVHVDGAWYGLEESRLAFTDLDLSHGVGYDRYALQFGWQPDPPLDRARFTFDGTLLARTGDTAGVHVPVTIDLACRATHPPIPTGTGDDERRSPYEALRFEQPLEASGRVVVGDRQHAVGAGAHRDKSWGPRDWRQAFTLGDIQAGGRQLYFVGRSFPEQAGGFLREGDGAVQHVRVVDGSVEYDDAGRTVAPGWLRFQGPDATEIDVEFAPVGPSVAFDMAHTCDAPEHWLYWRALIRARISGTDAPVRGWFEASRYGLT
jgi:hypothetical protein